MYNGRRRSRINSSSDTKKTVRIGNQSRPHKLTENFETTKLKCKVSEAGLKALAKV